jgi:hypothetical protein
MSYYGLPLRHDFIRDTLARNENDFHLILSNKIKFLKWYRIQRTEIEFGIWKKMAKLIKFYSFKTKPEADGKLDIMFILEGFGEKEGITRSLCIEIKDGEFSVDDLLKYKIMENVFHNIPILPADSSEDPLIVLAWEENINKATDNQPGEFEKEHNWSIRFIPLERFYPLLQREYFAIGEGIV